MLPFKVSEMFVSLQGESSYAGQRCFFIRLVGCNLRCAYCDTLYAQTEDCDYTPMILSDILDKVTQSGVKLVELTGGEPLMEKQLPLLISELQNKGCRVLVETNGSCDISVLPQGTIRIMDVKTPSSLMHEFNMFANIAHLTSQDEVKFVIGTREDFDYAQNVIREYQLTQRTEKIYFSPVADTLPFADLAAWMIEAETPARFQLQLHKIIWPNIEKGV